MSFIHEITRLQEFQDLFTVRSPIDLVGIGFFFLILYVVIGGTVSMIYNQFKYIVGSIVNRSDAQLEVSRYTRTVLDGTSPELRALQRSDDPIKQNSYINDLCRGLARDGAPIARSLVKQLRARQRRLFVDVKYRAKKPRTNAVRRLPRAVAIDVEGNS